jgi:hypothetical protein
MSLFGALQIALKLGYQVVSILQLKLSKLESGLFNRMQRLVRK